MNARKDLGVSVSITMFVFALLTPAASMADGSHMPGPGLTPLPNRDMFIPDHFVSAQPVVIEMNSNTDRARLLSSRKPIAVDVGAAGSTALMRGFMSVIGF
jgi:hypothetical protein